MAAIRKQSVDFLQGGGDGKTAAEVLNALKELVNGFRADGAGLQMEEVQTTLSTLRSLLWRPEHAVRCGALRAVRYALQKPEHVELLNSLCLFFFIDRCLEGKARQNQERVQALKVLRRCMNLHVEAVPVGCVQSIISVAENQEDSMRHAALEVLRELATLQPKIVSAGNGFKTLAEAVIDPQLQDSAEAVVLTLLFIFNSESSRQYFRPALDLQLMLSPFTDNTQTCDVLQINAARRALRTLLRSWAGIIAVTSHHSALPALINFLQLPGAKEPRLALLETIFQIVRMPVPSSEDIVEKLSSGSNRRIGSFGDDEETLKMPPPRRQRYHDIIKNYLCILLLSFIQCGLFKALIQLGMKSDPEMGSVPQVATVLLGELLHLADKLLPVSQLASLHSLPDLVKLAGTFTTDTKSRSQASNALSALHQFALNKRSQAEAEASIGGNALIAGSNKFRKTRRGVDRIRDRLELTQKRFEMSMDDREFETLLKSTSNVLMTKEYAKWDWRVISDIISGPITSNQSRFLQCLKNDFIPRLLGFYHPRTPNGFITLPRGNEHSLKTRVGCELFELLLSCPQGQQCLLESRFIEDVSKMLTEELTADSLSTTSMLSPDKISRTLAREYFTFIGTFSCSVEGTVLLEQPPSQILMLLERLIQRKGREDIVRLIVTSLDYSVASPCRDRLLPEAMKSQSKLIRYHATKHLRMVFRAGQDNFHMWGVSLLVSQLEDADKEVQALAGSILEETCQHKMCLEALVGTRPALTPLTKACKNLVLRFLSTESGFLLLQNQNWIEHEMEAWHWQMSHAYVSVLEAELTAALNCNEEKKLLPCVVVGPHFYGEIANTKNGADLLRQSGHVQEIVTHLRESETFDLHYRSCLWALGHIGSSINGLAFLDEADMVKFIVNLAETGKNLALRGTCFYVLGLLSRTQAGREALLAQGWICPQDPYCNIAVPQNPARLLSIPKYSFVSQSSANSLPLSFMEDEDSDITAALNAVHKMCNQVAQSDGKNELIRLKQQKNGLFSDPKLLVRVWEMMDRYRFKLQIRRNLTDLFSNTVFTQQDFDNIAKYRKIKQ